MTNQHPITPPPELKEQWRELALRDCQDEAVCDHWLMNRASQWGADTELEACIQWLAEAGYAGLMVCMRSARRPKPPSLKEQALAALEDANLDAVHYNIIRHALEELSNG